MRRWPVTYWLVLLVALAAVGYAGVRWTVTIVYPLEYRDIVFKRAREFGLDPFLVTAVIRRESRFRPDATSSEGARGLMQLMPGTGADVAQQMQLPFAPEMLYDPDYNVRLGCYYLAHLRREFGGDTVMALAAYNGGRANVESWLREKKWTGEHQTLDQIPFKETRLYVANVLTDFRRYQLIYSSSLGTEQEVSAGGLRR